VNFIFGRISYDLSFQQLANVWLINNTVICQPRMAYQGM